MDKKEDPKELYVKMVNELNCKLFLAIERLVKKEEEEEEEEEEEKGKERKGKGKVKEVKQRVNSKE